MKNKLNYVNSHYSNTFRLGSQTMGKGSILSVLTKFIYYDIYPKYTLKHKLYFSVYPYSISLLARNQHSEQFVLFVIRFKLTRKEFRTVRFLKFCYLRLGMECTRSLLKAIKLKLLITASWKDKKWTGFWDSNCK